MKLKQIVDAKAPLTRMIDKELPLKTAHALWKIITKANESLGFFETKRRSILQTYGEENAGRYVPKEGMENDMHAKILELLGHGNRMGCRTRGDLRGRKYPADHSGYHSTGTFR